VVDLIRGRKANDAVILLRTVNKRIAPAVEKVLHSAIANIQGETKTWTWIVSMFRAYVMKVRARSGPSAPMGRAYRYQRRTSHIVVKVAEKQMVGNRSNMGQKVHPYGFRLGLTNRGDRAGSRAGLCRLLREDLELKEGLRKQLKSAGVSSIEVDRPATSCGSRSGPHAPESSSGARAPRLKS